MAAQTITSWLAIPTIESGILPWKIRKFFNLSIARSMCILTLAMLDVVALRFLDSCFPVKQQQQNNLNVRN